MMTEQTAKADARKSAHMAPTPDRKIAKEAIKDAQSRQKRLPAQKLSQLQTDDTPGKTPHHDKDQIVSEFDDPSKHTVAARY